MSTVCACVCETKGHTRKMNFTESCVTLVISLFAFGYCQSQSQSQIKAITIVHRHGDRYPRDSYPNDPFKGLFKEQDLGQLLPSGCLRMYNNGRFLGQTFPQLSERKHTQVTSSVKRRCIESAHCLLAGIDGPQVSPVSYNIATAESVEKDPLLNHADVDCPERAYEIITGPFYRGLFDDYRSLFDQFSRVTGEQYTVNDTYMFFDLRISSLLAQSLMGLKMPEWASPSFLREAEAALDFSFGLQSRLSIEDALNGVFFRDMLEKWNNASSRSLTSLFVYSTHDTTLGSLMTAVNAWTGKRPLYGEALVFLYTDDEQIQVHYLHQNHTLARHYPRGCSQSDCSLETFTSYVMDTMPEDWRTECNRHSVDGPITIKRD